MLRGTSGVLDRFSSGAGHVPSVASSLAVGTGAAKLVGLQSLLGRNTLMPLTSCDDIRTQLIGDIYATADLPVAMPKYKMPEHEHKAENAFSVVRDELMLDGNSRQNLATFCQTWVDDQARQPNSVVRRRISRSA
jgi:hypothetical protein